MPAPAPKPARKPSRTSLITERLMADFANCQRFSLPCRFSVGRYTGYSAGVVGALQRRGYVVVKVRGSQYEITGHQSESEAANPPGQLTCRCLSRTASSRP